MNLEGEAEDAVLELSEDELISDASVNNVLDKLDKVFKKSDTVEKFEALDRFETYRRPHNVSISDFVIEFDKRYNKTKSLGTNVSDDLLGYRMIKSANLCDQDEKMIKATCVLTYDDVKSKLKSIFSDAGNSLSVKNENIKKEEVFEVHNSYYGYNNSLRGRGGRGRNRGRGRGRGRGGRGRGTTSVSKVEPKRNPLTQSGKVSVCAICKSEMHWARECPHREEEQSLVTENNEEDEEEEDALLSEHVVLMQTPDSESSLLSETWNCALLDSGASKTVAGRMWLDNFIEGLPEKEKEKVKFSPSKSSYKFGDGTKIQALQNVVIPAKMGNTYIRINTDVVDKEIPLLMSRETMKKARMKIDCYNNRAQVFGGEELILNETSKGHWIIPLTEGLQMLQKFEKGTIENITLNLYECQDNKKLAKRMHSNFAHPSSERLIRLVNSADEKWSNNNELKDAIKEVTERCVICRKHKKTPPRPVVGFPMATKFNECVAMDLKFYEGKIILHMIDHLSKLSAGERIPSKEPKIIIKSIFKNWVSVYGPPNKFLSDNGGEFMNASFIEMCEQMNITVKNTAGRSPWSNGLVERHNLVISEMLEKVLAESKCDFDAALSWCLTAKNSLQNVNGFTPYQIAIGRNPTFPFAVENDLPANTSVPVSDVVKNNLNAMHQARESYIKSENSQKLKRSVSSNARTANGAKFFIGDQVFYKRDEAREWKGPASVLGQDGQKVIIKHGPYNVSVHPCRVILKEESKFIDDTKHNEENEETESAKNNEMSLADQRNETQEDDSSEDEETENPNGYESKSTNNITQTSNNDHAHEVTNSRNKVKKGDEVTVHKLNGNLEDRNFIIVNRAGKATGKYSNCWNVKDKDSGESSYIDFNKVNWSNTSSNDAQGAHGNNIEEVGERESAENDENLEDSSHEVELIFVNSEAAEIQREEIHKAKLKELSDWKSHDVYKSVKDIGQKQISTRWVISKKIENEQVITKARLVARGFEEIQDFRKDSPTCSKEMLRVVLSLASSHGWSVNSLDVSRAFLQGDHFDRKVFLTPPKEAQSNELWELKKCVYGLGDASRQWYLTLKRRINKAGGQTSAYDNGLFFCHGKDEKLIGLMPCHVDDILWTGKEEFEKGVIRKLKETFVMRTTGAEAFEYVGIELKQNTDMSIRVSQTLYAATLQPIEVSPGRKSDKSAPLTKTETTQLRGAIGQLNWMSCTSRPDISYDVSVASSNIKGASVNDLLHINKVIKKVKQEISWVTFPKLDMNSLHIRSFADASYNNLKNGGSQGGHVIFLADQYNRCCPIEWKSNRLKRVVRSPLAAETLACSDCVESDIFLASALKEILKREIRIVHYTDSQSLLDNLKSKKTVSDKLLRVDINLIKESMERNHVEVKWIEGERNLSDVMTKAGVNSKPLLNTLRYGSF